MTEDGEEDLYVVATLGSYIVIPPVWLGSTVLKTKDLIDTAVYVDSGPHVEARSREHLITRTWQREGGVDRTGQRGIE